MTASTSISLTGLSRVELTFEQLWADGSAQLSVQLGSVELNLLFRASAEGLSSWWKLRQQAKAPSYWMMVEAERVEREAAHQRALEFYLHHSKRRTENVTQQVERDLEIIRQGFGASSSELCDSADDDYRSADRD